MHIAHPLWMLSEHRVGINTPLFALTFRTAFGKPDKPAFAIHPPILVEQPLPCGIRGVRLARGVLRPPGRLPSIEDQMTVSAAHDLESSFPVHHFNQLSWPALFARNDRCSQPAFFGEHVLARLVDGAARVYREEIHSI